MLKRLFPIARAASLVGLLVFGAGLALISAQAAAARIPIADPEGPHLLPGWRAHRYTPEFNSSINVYNDLRHVDNALGIYDYAKIWCAKTCPAGDSNSIAVQIDDFVAGHQYQIAFWAMGYWKNDRGYPAISFGETKLSVGVGSHVWSPMAVPLQTSENIYYETKALPWKRITLDFTWTDPGSTTLLTFSHALKEVTLAGCTTCSEALWIGGLSLEDVTPSLRANGNGPKPTAGLKQGMLQ